LATVGAGETLVISFKPHKPEYTLNEPVFVDLFVTNQLREDVRLDLGPEHLQFIVTSPGETRKVLTRPPVEGIRPISRVTLKPGQVDRRRILLNEWYSFDRSGTYTFEVKLAGPAETANGASILVPASGGVTLRILPRDPARLKAVCEELAKTAIGTSDVATATEAALALSYVRDPIAVPFLERVLKEAKLVGYHALTGLARIANSEAVRALIAATREGDAELRSQAVYALSQAKANVKDEALKKQIERALGDHG
jgi:hypothetical protein